MLTWITLEGPGPGWRVASVTSTGCCLCQAYWSHCHGPILPPDRSARGKKILSVVDILSSPLNPCPVGGGGKGGAGESQPVRCLSPAGNLSRPGPAWRAAKKRPVLHSPRAGHQPTPTPHFFVSDYTQIFSLLRRCCYISMAARDKKGLRLEMIQTISSTYELSRHCLVRLWIELPYYSSFLHSARQKN